MFKNFFELYADAFLSSNSNYISDVYEYPMVFYTENGDMIRFKRRQFLENTEKLIALYEKLGVEKVTFNIESNLLISKKLSLVSIVWCFLNGKGSEICRSTTRYIIRETDTGLKIKSVFVVDEISNFNAAKQT